MMTYRQACDLVRSVGMNVVDGLALTYSSAKYPEWVTEMNGWNVEAAAAEITRRADALSETSHVRGE